MSSELLLSENRRFVEGSCNVMPGCGGVLPELTVASCQNSVCTLFLAVYFLSRFPSKFRSPVRRHCWKEHCWKELLERALLEGAVGKSYWKEPALSRD